MIGRGRRFSSRSRALPAQMLNTRKRIGVKKYASAYDVFLNCKSSKTIYISGFLKEPTVALFLNRGTGSADEYRLTLRHKGV